MALEDANVKLYQLFDWFMMVLKCFKMCYF